MKIKLLPKFILSLGVIGVILTIAISLFSYRSSRSYLENLYAQRVMTNSNSIADMMSVSDVEENPGRRWGQDRRIFGNGYVV